MSAPPVLLPIRALMVLYVFLLPFEMPHRAIPFEVPTLLGCLILLAALLQPRRCLQHMPAAFWLFLTYSALEIFLMLIALPGGELSLAAAKRLFYSAQLPALFLVTYNLFRAEPAAREGLVALLLGTAALALLVVTGVTPPVYNPAIGARVTAFGQNPNRMAYILSLGFLALLGLAYSAERPALRFRFAAWPALLALGYAVVLSGSRGGLMALGLGASVLLATAKNLRARVRNVALLVLALGVLGVFVSSATSTRERLEDAFVTGNMAGRERLFPLAWEMFLERPITGWGAVAHQYELGARERAGFDARDTHNLLLEILTATGVVGALPFLAGTWLCLAGAWRARHGLHGALPLAMVIGILMMNLSGNLIHFKAHWLVMAYALASGTWRARSRVEDTRACAE
jgi:O-antigen ligase